MSQIEILLIFFVINLFLTLNFDKIKIFRIILDKPDKIRKFHKKPTALAGGIILIINFIFYLIFLNFNNVGVINENIFENLNEINFFIFTCLLIFTLGIIDDKFNLNPFKKFLFLTIILIQFIYFDKNIIVEILQFSFLKSPINLGNYSFIFTIFCFLVFMNAFNMFDGINLQTSIYSLLILIFFLTLNKNSLLITFLIIYISFFIYLNYLNKSFLGDSGTLLISFVISVIFIKLFNQKLITYSDQILIYMIVPGLDMIRLFFERIKNKRNPFSFDRLHLHHLLLKRLNYSKTISTIILLIILPIVLDQFFFNKIMIILITTFIYSLIIIFLKKE